jgi:hypothetical protein
VAGTGVVRGGEEQQRLDRDAPVEVDEIQRALTAAHGPEIELGEAL